MKGYERIALILLVAMLWTGWLAVDARAQAAVENVLHSFTGQPGDGADPWANLTADSSGNLYGTTTGGGAYSVGSVFELVNSSGAYTEKVLFNFTNTNNGADPEGNLIMDSSGNLYEMTTGGGAYGSGSVFELVNSSGSYSENVLYSFQDYDDGGYPRSGVIMDALGNLYGTTAQGANGNCVAGCGTVFELVNSSGGYAENVLYSFTGTAGDGGNPYASLIMDSSGNLYGTTTGGGAAGDGTVFELINSSGSYTENVLYSFAGGDGSFPYAGLTMDSSGNLYGTTYGGGAYNAGTVFELVNSSGTYREKVLYTFTDSAGDGAYPSAGLVMNSSGNLYGTTLHGGNSNCSGGCGTAFALVNSSGAYTEQLLHNFTGTGGDGAYPYASLIIDSSGNLDGTTMAGGVSNYGTVFQLVPVVTLSPASLAFGNQLVGTTSVAQNVVLTNGLLSTLTIGSVSVTGDFAQANNCGSMLVGGASCTIMVSFVPSQIGPQSGMLTVTDNAPGSPQIATLSGTGAPDSVPVVSSPLVPATAMPGAPGFTLTVNGSGFISSDVVAWNGSSRTTTFVSATQLTAEILDSDVTSAGTDYVTVINPNLPDRTSNSAAFEVTTPTSFLTLGSSNLTVGTSPAALISADVNADGKMDLVATNGKGSTISALLGKGDGTFNSQVTYATGSGPYGVSAGDFNADGKLDLAVANHGASTVSILLGNGDGTFQKQVSYGAGTGAQSIAVGDFNQDGKLDLAVENGGASTVSILLGNGDGTFQTAVNYTTGTGPSWVVAGDFNGDGVPDLATANYTAGSASILLGNGDGTFQPHVDYSVGSEPLLLATGDFNGDAKPDLAVTDGGSNNVSILLGNGDGTFRSAVNYATGTQPFGIAVGDLNGDGQLDLAVANETSGTVSTLLGNGDGTFQTQVSFVVGSGPDGVALGDFNGDGRLDLATTNKTANSTSILLQTNGVSLSPTSLNFGNLNIGSSSSAQTVTLSNTGSAPLAISSIAITGANSTDFGQTNTCGSTLAGGASCSIGVTFKPTASGARSASLTLSDNGPGNPQSAALSGTGLTVVTLSPTSLNFGNVAVGSTSAPQVVTLRANGSLSISSITTSGPYAQTNTCGSGFTGSGRCTISVTFTPTAPGTQTGTLTVTDSGAASPQTVSLTGVGTQPGVQLSPATLTFATQVVFTTSSPQNVTLTNTGNGTLSITGISVTGQFSQTNTCGSSVAPGAKCMITVKFTPKSKGPLTGRVSVTDNAPGSPQTVSLTGTGTYIQLSPTTINFGSQPVGTTSLPKRITMTNKGSTSVSIASIAITGTNSGDFAQTNNCGSSLASGASCFVSVTFTPSAKGKRTASVSITDNGGGSPQTVSLTGSGT
jgi:uncharacterized repeat protein (TIGR03803 family)